MTGRLGLLVALALVTACKQKDTAPAAADKPGSAGAPGPAQEGSAKPQPSEATPEGSKPPPEPPPVDPAPAPIAWDRYRSKAGGFTVELPGKAEEKEQGGLQMVGAEFGVTKDDPRTAMCGVAYMALPAADDPKKILEASVARHKQNATVIEDKEITLGSNPGRALVVENASHRKWMRVYLVDKRIYILNCGGPVDRAKTDGPIAEKALGSFALAK